MQHVPSPDPAVDSAPCQLTTGAEEPLAELARNLLAAGDAEGAAEAFDQALALAPHRADLFVELGIVRQELNDPEGALACYHRAVEVDPENISARQNLGYLLCNLGEPEQAIEHYEHLLKIWPSPISRMLAATVLPVIYDSAEDARDWRERFATRLQELADAGLRVDTTRSQIPTNFQLAFQGENDRELAVDFGRIYQGCERSAPGKELGGCGGAKATPLARRLGLRQLSPSHPQPGSQAAMGGCELVFSRLFSAITPLVGSTWERCSICRAPSSKSLCCRRV